MDNKLDQLTHKIYQEGIEKANQDAGEIVEKAKKEARDIIDNSKKEADRIKKQAEDEAGQLRRNTEADLKLAGNQAISSLKQNIKELLSQKILNQPMGKLMVDPDFLKQLILALTKHWDQQEGIELKFSKDLQEKMDQAFENSLKKEIKDLTISYDGKLSQGFRVEPKGSSFQITFTEQDFIAFFKPYLKEKAEKLIFAKE